MKRPVAASIGAVLTTALIAATGGSATAVPGGGNLLLNPGFEQGQNGDWKGNSETITTSDPHSGAWIAYMAATGSPNRDSLYQRVTIPEGTAATLTFWLKNTTDEDGADDTFEVKVTNAADVTRTHKTLTSADATETYVRYRVVLNRYLGKTVRVRFIATEDQGNRTDFQLDDTALRVS